MLPYSNQKRVIESRQLIVDAAAEVLGIKDPNITAELIHGMLNPNGNEQID